MTAPASVAPAPLLEVFERHVRWVQRRCTVCGRPSGDLAECIGCTVAEEAAAKRREDR